MHRSMLCNGKILSVRGLGNSGESRSIPCPSTPWAQSSACKWLFAESDCIWFSIHSHLTLLVWHWQIIHINTMVSTYPHDTSHFSSNACWYFNWNPNKKQRDWIGLMIYIKIVFMSHSYLHIFRVDRYNITVVRLFPHVVKSLSHSF